MSQFTVVEIVSAERKDGDKGKSLTEKLRLRDETGQVIEAELWRPGEPPASTVNQVYEGTVRVDPKWGPKLDIPRQSNGGKGGGGGWKGRSPEELAQDRELRMLNNRSIEAQVALKAAVELTVGLSAQGKLPPQFTQDGEALSQAICRIAGQFYDEVHGKAKHA